MLPGRARSECGPHSYDVLRVSLVCARPQLIPPCPGGVPGRCFSIAVSPPLPLPELVTQAMTEEVPFQAACAESLLQSQPVCVGAALDPPRGRIPVDSWRPPFELPVARTALDVSGCQIEWHGRDLPSNVSSGPTMPRAALPQVVAFQLIVRSLEWLIVWMVFVLRVQTVKA